MTTATPVFDQYSFTNVSDGQGGESTYDSVSYVLADPTIDYPSSDIETTFGPIFAPKLWANELSALELASAGKMIFTLSNEHALDVDEIEKVIYFEARNSNSLCFRTDDGSVSLCLMDGDDTLKFRAAGGISFETPELGFNVGDFSVSACNAVDISAQNSNVSISTGAGDVELSSGRDVRVESVRDTIIDAGRDVGIGANNVSVAASNDMALAASNDVSVAAGAALGVEAKGDIAIATDAELSATSAGDMSLESTGAGVGVYAGTDIVAHAANEVSIAASNALAIASVDSDVTVAAGNDFDVAAANDVDIAASNHVRISAAASNVTIAAGDTFDVDAGDSISLAASNAVEVTAVSSSVVVSAGDDIDLGASNSVMVTASNAVQITAAASNVTVSAGLDFDVEAARDISLAASNDVYISANSNLYLTGRGVQVDSTTLEVSVSDTATITASNALTLESVKDDVVVKAPEGAVDVDANEVDIDAKDTLSLTASNAVTITSHLETVSIVSEMSSVVIESKETIELNAEDSVLVTACNEARISACNSVSVVSEYGDVTLESKDGDIYLTVPAGCNIEMISGSNTFTFGHGPAELSSEDQVTIESTDSNVIIRAASNVEISSDGDTTIDSDNVSVTACNVFYLQAGQGIDLATPCNATVTTGGDASVDAAGDINLTANNNITLVTIDEDITIDSGRRLIVSADEGFSFSNTETGDIYLSNDAPDGMLLGRAQGGIDLQANADVSVAASNNLEFQAANGDATIGAPLGKIVYNASGTYGQDDTGGAHLWRLGASDVVQIGHNPNWPQNNPATSNPSQTPYLVTINADFDVLGNINSTGINQTVLEIEDKVIFVAYNHSNALPGDGVVNAGAGLEVDGIPSADSGGTPITEDPEKFYVKSLKWYPGTGGVPAVGASWGGDAVGPAAAFWELDGGDFRVTKTYDRDGVSASNGAARDKGDKITYGFRVNEFEELEIYKKSLDVSTGNTNYKRVAKFGRQVV